MDSNLDVNMAWIFAARIQCSCMGQRGGVVRGVLPPGVTFPPPPPTQVTGFLRRYGTQCWDNNARCQLCPDHGRVRIQFNGMGQRGGVVRFVLPPGVTFSASPAAQVSLYVDVIMEGNVGTTMLALQCSYGGSPCGRAVITEGW